MDATHQIELSIQAAKELVDAGEAVQRLFRNQDFLKIIKKGYFEDEAVRLVHLKSDHNMQTSESQASILRQMDAIGSLRQYLVVIQQNAQLANKALIDDQEELIALQREEAGA